MKTTLQRIFANKKIIRPIIISATSLKNANHTYFYKENIEKDGYIDILMSSTAIPLLFPPYPYNDDYYVDGGLSSNIILNEAIKYCDKYYPNETIYIDMLVCGKKIPKDYTFTLTFYHLINRLITIITQQVEYEQLLDFITDDNKRNDINLRIFQEKDEIPINILNFNENDYLYSLGYNFNNVEVIEKF